MLGEVAINDVETGELLAIYDDTTSRYHAAKTGVERRLIFVDWAGRITDFLAKHPQSPYFPGASLQLADYHARLLNQSRARQYAETAWMATRERSEPAARQIARESAFLLANALILRGDFSAYDELYAAERSLSPRATEDRWSGLQEQRHHDVRNPDTAANCGLVALSQMLRVLEGPQRPVNPLLAHRPGPAGIDLATLGRIGREAGLAVRAVRLAGLEAFPVPCIVHVASEHYLTVLERRGDFYEVSDPATGHVRWMIAPELVADATGVLLVARQSRMEGVSSMQDLSDPNASLFRGRKVSWWPGLDALGPDGGYCPGHPGHGSGRAGASEGGPLDTGARNAAGGCDDCGSPGMPTWQVDEPTLNVRINDTPLIYQPKYGPTMELSLTFHSRRRYAGSSTFLPEGRFEVGPVDARYMLASSWMSWVEYDTNTGLEAYVSHAGGGVHRYTFLPGVDWSNLEYWSHSHLEKLYDGGSFIGFRLHQADGRTREYLQAGQTSGWFAGYYMTADKDAAGLGTTFEYQSGTSMLTQVTAADGTVFTVGYGTGSLANAIVSVTSSIGLNASFGYDETQAHPSGVASEGLSSITDVVGIQSFLYLVAEGTSYIRTPYGRTTLDVRSAATPPPSPTIDRSVEVWHPTGSSEAFALMLNASSVVPGWQTNQIPNPTSAVVSTLDTANRGLRNTYHWPPQVRSVMTKNLATESLTWSDLRRARTRHWLKEPGGRDEFQTLSWEQAASPDGTSEGAVLWYDYAGKSDPDRAGTESYPAVEARVMPDGTTWYRDYTRNTLGKPLAVRERWDDGAGYPSRVETFTYSSDGVDLLIHTNALGIAELRLGYDGSHRVIARTNALNEVERFGYDASGRLIGQTNAADWRLVRTFSTDGWSVTNVAYLGSSAYQTNTEVTYLNQSYTRTNLNAGNITQATRWVVSTDARGLVTTNIFDPLGRLWERRTTGGLVEEWHYELHPGESYATGSGGTRLLDVTAYVNALGQMRRMTYDGIRRLVQTVDTRGTTNQMAYCDCGSPATVVEAAGTTIARTASYEYDFQGKRWKSTTPEGSMSTNHYDLLGRLVLVQDPFGWSTNRFDNLGRLVQTLNAAGSQMLLTLDVLDRVRIRTDLNGVTVTNAYDALGRVQTVHRAGSATPYLAYGYSVGFDGPTAETNGVGAVRTFAYDAAQRRTAEVQVGLWTNSFTYHPAGDLQFLFDGRTNRTEWRYDAFGRIREKWYQGQTNADLVYSYDRLGRLTNRFSRTGNPGTNGYDTTYAYDRGGSLTNVSSPGYAGNVARTYAYDALGRMTNMTDAVGTTAYAYTLLGSGISAMSEDGPWTNDVVNVTNRHGLRSHLVINQPAGSFTTTYQWDASRRMTNVTGGGQSFGYVYGAAGRLITRVNLPGGGTITNTFDSLARQTGTELLASGGTTRNRHAYAYDAADRRTWISRANSTSTNWNGFSVFGYDAASQLISARTTNPVTGDEVTSERFGYVYDASQNLRWRTNNTTVTGFTNNVLNQLTALNAIARNHDRRGNLLSNVQAGETLLYSWDDESQLTSVRMDPASTPAFQPWRIDFVYDGLRRLRRALQFTWNGSAWTSQGEVRYLYDGMLIVQERNAGHTPQVQYTRGLDLSGTIEGAGGIGGLLMRSHGYSAGNWSTHNAYHSDANGNVTALMSSAGVLQASYKYNPYGGLISSSGPLAGANTMRFSSKPAILSATGAWGFYYYGYRFYDPANQRWFNRDPIEEEGGVNLYLMVDNNANSWFDPLGLQQDSVSKGIGKSGGVAEEYLKELAIANARRKLAEEAAKALAKRCTDKIGKLAQELKKTEKQIRDAIHKVKENLKGSGPKRNPDVKVDPATGEVYPMNPNGSLGDSIGNIFDFLP